MVVQNRQVQRLTVKKAAQVVALRTNERTIAQYVLHGVRPSTVVQYENNVTNMTTPEQHAT